MKKDNQKIAKLEWVVFMVLFGWILFIISGVYSFIYKRLTKL